MKFFIALFLLALSMLFAGLSLEAYQCQTYGEVVGVETQYRLGTCFLKTRQGWYSWDEFKLRDIRGLAR